MHAVFLTAFAGCFLDAGIGLCRMDYRPLPDVFLDHPCRFLADGCQERRIAAAAYKATYK